MFNNERVGVIGEYNNTFGNINPNVGYWQRLSDYFNRMSADQQNFVNNDKKVTKCRTKMMEAFNLFIFERYKDEFIQLDSFRKLCDDYIDSVINAGNSYAEKVSKMETENETLKAKVAELERKLKEPNE